LYPWYFFGFFGLALPCIGITEKPVWPVDRYSYLLDAVLLGMIAGALVLILAGIKRQWPIWVGLAVILVASTTASMRLLSVWKNTDTLFSHIERHPDFGSSIVQEAHIYLLWHIQLMTEGREEEGRDKLAIANETYLAAMRQALQEGNYEYAVFLSRVLEENIGITPEICRERAAWLFKLGRRDEGAKELARAAADLPNDERVKQLEETYKAAMQPPPP